MRNAQSFFNNFKLIRYAVLSAQNLPIQLTGLRNRLSTRLALYLGVLLLMSSSFALSQTTAYTGTYFDVIFSATPATLPVAPVTYVTKTALPSGLTSQSVATGLRIYGTPTAPAVVNIEIDAIGSDKIVKFTPALTVTLNLSNVNTVGAAALPLKQAGYLNGPYQASVGILSGGNLCPIDITAQPAGFSAANLKIDASGNLSSPSLNIAAAIPFQIACAGAPAVTASFVIPPSAPPAQMPAAPEGDRKVLAAILVPPAPVVQPIKPTLASMQIARIALGSVISATSGSDPTAKLFADVSADLPLGDPVARWKPWLWASGRVSSMPQSTAIVSPSQLTTTLTSTTTTSAQPQQIVQSGELEAGFAMPFWINSTAQNSQETHWMTASLIMGGGIVTPLSTDQATQQISVYNATADVQKFYSAGQYSQYANSFTSACNTTATSTTPSAPQVCYVAFIPEDRARFYRNYAGGLRFKYYWRDVKSDTKQNYYPATFDATIGQNEFITGGKTAGPVFHGAAFFRVPDYPIFIFGSMDLGLKGAGDPPGPPLFQASGQTYSFSSATIVTVAVPPPNRDRYAIGIAVDLSTIFPKK